MVAWTDERVAALSTPDLKNLLANAERKDVAEVVAQCTAELEKRQANKPRKAGQPRTETKQFEHDMAGELATVGKAMAEKYDLTEETAKAASVGVKGFKSHKLLDAKGFAKLGGSQRDGSVAIDRYISHRRGNSIATLGVWLAKDKPVEEHEFLVGGPKGMVEGGETFTPIDPAVAEKDAQASREIKTFKDLPAATTAFDGVLAKITAA
jgi:hypothetical protein